MALYLLYRTRPEDRRPSGLHTAVVQAADEASARTAAGVPVSWSALALSGLANGGVLRIEGDAVSLLGMDRGGNPVG